MKIHGKDRSSWIKEYPLLDKILELQPVSWFNPEIKNASYLSKLEINSHDIEDARARLKRFAPYFLSAFPETHKNSGILESPIAAVPNFQAWLSENKNQEFKGSFWLKLDSELPISGSIKARGGIYEVLQHAESLALKAGLIKLNDDYAKFNTKKFKDFFSKYSVAVGSTGNLGLSIGIMSAIIGFKASVHMSADARDWKKKMLRSHGVTVHEYESDYSEAVRKGREEAAGDPNTYFVDDENSQSLFLGYAVSAQRLKGQLQSFDIEINEENPLFVYLPCGVGGGPGGVAFGLKHSFGDNVHCIFCEPTHSPSMLLGVYTGLHSKTSVQDFGIDNLTAADGLACGRPSSFVGETMQHFIDGFYTMSDDMMFGLLSKAYELDGYKMEPSSSTSLEGPAWVLSNNDYLNSINMTEEKLKNSIHLSWITGGSMVPETEMQGYIQRGKTYKF